MPGLQSFRVDGRRALVTGGGKGLGLAISKALAEAGADVVIASRSRDACEAAARDIAAATGRRTAALAVDLADSAQAARLVLDAEAAIGPLDILINNAGINIRGASEELTEGDWDAVVDTNLKAPFLLARAVGPAMAKRGWGRIVNLGSILSVIGIAGRAPYAASKAGLLNLTRVLALEWAARGVTVNALCPGPFGTEMNRTLTSDPAKYKAFLEKIPMGRWGEPEEIAGAVLFLSSDASSFVTGSALFVDGGWTAQ